MERIKTTPMTYGYVATLRFFLILWLVTLPIALIGSYHWVAPPILAFIAYLFFNIEQMAIEIEQPFGDDANALPIEEYIIDLEKVALATLVAIPRSYPRSHPVAILDLEKGALAVPGRPASPGDPWMA